MRQPIGLCAALACMACALAAGSAAQAAAPTRTNVRLAVRLLPYHLGQSSSIALALRIGARGGGTPPRLERMEALYPQGFGIALSGLGIETCSAARLQARGPSGCPADSLMGRGRALGVPAGAGGSRREHATITIVRAPNVHGHIALLFDAQGLGMSEHAVILSALVLGAHSPYGGDIRVSVPPIGGDASGGEVSLISLSATIGPAANLHYTERVRRHLLSYVPRGIALPERCPRGGFPFAARLAFEGGTSAEARTRVSCPPRRRGSASSGRRRR